MTVTAGLGLLPVTVDVHAAQWGTLARLIAAVAAGLVDSGVAIDEDTLLAVGADGAGPGTVHGAGQVHWVRRGDTSVLVTGVPRWSVPRDGADGVSSAR